MQNQKPVKHWYLLPRHSFWVVLHFRKTILVPTGKRSSQQYFTHPFSSGVHVGVAIPKAPCPALTPQPRPATQVPGPGASCHTRSGSPQGSRSRRQRGTALRLVLLVLKQRQTSSRKKSPLPQNTSQTARQPSPNTAAGPARAFYLPPGTGGSHPRAAAPARPAATLAANTRISKPDRKTPVTLARASRSRPIKTEGNPIPYQGASHRQNNHGSGEGKKEAPRGAGSRPPGRDPSLPAPLHPPGRALQAAARAAGGGPESAARARRRPQGRPELASPCARARRRGPAAAGRGGGARRPRRAAARTPPSRASGVPRARSRPRRGAGPRPAAAANADLRRHFRSARPRHPAARRKRGAYGGRQEPSRGPERCAGPPRKQREVNRGPETPRGRGRLRRLRREWGDAPFISLTDGNIL